MTEKRVI